jgi:hypothetical protein
VFCFGTDSNARGSLGGLFHVDFISGVHFIPKKTQKKQNGWFQRPPPIFNALTVSAAIPPEMGRKSVDVEWEVLIC